ncbi:GntR family transcriptional regulator [Vagococcus sp. BWB3-3]|uniref:GntR family transcriptional regulator n=1 Tax=Vagococcus allomyrinae TaxID=2794353 RepID=A0A940SWW0_9ENTE|nr:GntR family transcriptional regulator [Vagococcus allomyrinae]MBP1042596.1 GntR family transcriptional regulator [Vagococcus allomyrinae]
MEEFISQKQHIYNFISSEISQGNLEYNGRLTEQYITDKLTISRTPVREALFQLAADGVLEHTPRKGFRIKKLSQEEVMEIYQLIGVLDGKAAELSLPQLTEEDFSTMQFLIDAMKSSINNKLYTKYNELQLQFHQVYTAKCGNQSLITALEKYKQSFLGTTYKNIPGAAIQATLHETNEEHQEILALLKKKEAMKLRQFIEDVHWCGERAKYDIW